jgi:hypothetical protein
VDNSVRSSRDAWGWFNVAVGLSSTNTSTSHDRGVMSSTHLSLGEQQDDSVNCTIKISSRWSRYLSRIVPPVDP